MLFFIVIIFTVSWLPLQTYQIVILLFPNIRQDIEYNSFQHNFFIGFYFFSHWLSMAHSCLNPLIYCFMNDKFRYNLKELICKSSGKCSCKPTIGSGNGTGSSQRFRSASGSNCIKSPSLLMENCELL